MTNKETREQFKRAVQSLQLYIVDIPWLLCNRKPYWEDACECGRLYCSRCGGKLFNKFK